jgi:hypothetical protein
MATALPRSVTTGRPHDESNDVCCFVAGRLGDHWRAAAPGR